MQLYNPFMPYRYLHPRASGLIAYKGGGGGATAEQVDESVQGGVTAVNENTNAGFAETAAVGETITDNQATMMGNQNTITDGIRAGLAGQNTIRDGIGMGLDNQKSLAQGQTGLSNQIASIPQTKVINQTVDTSGIENRIGSLEGVTDTGFASVNDSLSGVQGSVNSGFSDMNQSFNDVSEGQTNIQNSVSDLSGNMTNRFDAVDDNLNTGFASQADTLGTMSTDILSGQNSINSLLDTIGNNQNTYYGGLAQGQQEILGGVGGIQDTFSQFQNQYTDDTALANQTRARMEDTVEGGFNLVRDDMANTADAASRERMDIRGAVAQGTADIQDQQQYMQNDFGRTLKGIAADIPAQTQRDAAGRADIINRLDTVRNVLASQGNNIDGSIREEYTKLANSFDQNGKLIQESADQAGNTTRRQLDAQNNLLMATFNNTGQVLDQSALNVNQLLGALDNLGYTANQPSAVSSGLMGRDDPFFSTSG